MNRRLNLERPELHPVPVKSPWYHLGMDFIGPISPPSNSGNCYILTVSDYFTKFAWAKALPTKEAVNIVEKLKEVCVCVCVCMRVCERLFHGLLQICLIMGLPAVITSDRGREFHNALNNQLMREFGIDHRLTTAYHPQANGLDERFNQTLVNTRSKYTQEKRQVWDEKLAEVVYAYNTSVQESTKHTPFEAMFGRMARLPVDFNSAKHHDPDVVLEEYCTVKEGNELELCAQRCEMEQTIKENIAKAQTKQKQYYDRRHGAASCFGVGSLVLKKDFTRSKRKGGKLDYRWQGPFVITATL